MTRRQQQYSGVEKKPHFAAAVRKQGTTYAKTSKKTEIEHASDQEQTLPDITKDFSLGT